MTYSTEQILIAFSFTLFAGLCTGIGSAIALFARKTNYRFLAISLGFSAGVMLYVSFTEILSKTDTTFTGLYGSPLGSWFASASFFLGMIIIGLIDFFVPDRENPHEAPSIDTLSQMKKDSDPEDNEDTVKINGKLMRMGLFAALAIGIHNFPEGIATFFAALQDPALGIPITVAIALHNIPEGISVSVPVYYATGSRRKAFIISFLSGVSEPVGAIIGYLVLSTFFTPAVMGLLFGIVAGIMVYISIDELLPTAREYGKNHEVLYGIVSGMAVMSISLLLFK